MGENRFQIVFKKLEDELLDLNETSDFVVELEALQEEMDEIEELRTLVQETVEPEVESYTTT